MRQMKMGLYYVFGEPLMWLFYWCFQPDRFVREFEIRTAFKRVKPSLRLAFLIFLIDYPIALFARWGLHIILRIPSPHIMNFIISITLATLVGAMLGLFAGIGLGLTGGISIGLSSCLGFGLVVSSVDHTNETHILGGIAAGLVITCMLSVAGKSAGNAVI
ncbi:MAG: hypothetical protein JO031_02485, partial [Ktedonobacteraceae bacterium]|nr:hypothetical protein [Ktedonobacteraceae bacterium]